MVKKCLLPMLLLIFLAAPLRAADDQRLTGLAAEAYVYGFPLVLMDMTRGKMTAPAKPGGPGRTNSFTHIRAFPDYTFTDVVSPNADTLYSLAWLDLKNSPLVLELPEMGDRYYLMQFLDAWTNDFISLGSRTTGNRPGVFLIAGPGWTGETPPAMTLVKAPTNLVWILGRTETNGPADYEAVHAIQDRYRLRPLLDQAAPAEGPIHTPTSASPLEQVERLPALDFFAAFNRLMVDNPPAAADQPLLEKLAELSLGPNQPLDPESLPETVVQALEEGRNQALNQLRNLGGQAFGRVAQGWSILPDNTGDYGADYLLRAFIARFGLGANLLADAVYPTIKTEADGRPLNGRNSYAIHFAPGELPPVKAFWSITLYDDQQHFVHNPLDRYAIGDRDPLSANADGSLTIYVGQASPGSDQESNWLPAPAGDFNLIMRLYWPEPAILDGSWPLPRLEKTRP